MHQVRPGSINFSYTTPAYYSMDKPRAVTLIYRSALAHPVAHVIVDAIYDTYPERPTKTSIALKDEFGAWVTFLNGTQEIFYETLSYSSKARLAAAFDASHLATGSYEYTVVVRSWWADGDMKEATEDIRILVYNASASIFGAGWRVGGLQRIHVEEDGIVLTEGDGSILFFAESPGCTSTSCEYEPPAGDFTTLKLLHDGDLWIRWYPDGSEIRFEADGRIEDVLDRYGNTTSYGWNAGRLVSIAPPARGTHFLDYDANGKLTEISGPHLDERICEITVNGAGDLTRIEDPTGAVALQATYDADHRMIQRTDAGGGSWTFVYGYAGELRADSMPEVTLASGSNVRPTMSFLSPIDSLLARVGAGEGSFSNPAPHQELPDRAGRVTDPESESSYMRVNRFGQVTWAKNALGQITRTWYNGDGQIVRTLRLTLICRGFGAMIRTNGNRVSHSHVTDLSNRAKSSKIALTAEQPHVQYRHGSRETYNEDRAEDSYLCGLLLAVGVPAEHECLGSARIHRKSSGVPLRGGAGRAPTDLQLILAGGYM